MSQVESSSKAGIVGGMNHRIPILTAAVFVSALAPIFATPVLPLIDFYNHLARFYVLSHIGTDKLFQHYYQSHWTMLPNIGVDVIGTPLLSIFPTILAGHFLVILVLALLYSGVIAFHRVFTGTHSLLVGILLAPLLYSYILNWGFINFLLGLGLTFWAAAFWVATRAKPQIAIPVGSIYSVVIFLAHGVAFALYLILIVALEVGFFLNAPPRRSFDFLRTFSAVSVQAVIPALLFISWHANEVATKYIPDVLDPASVHQVHNGLYRLSTILRVEEGPTYWFDIMTFALQAGTMLLLFWRNSASLQRNSWPLIATTVVLMIVVPSQMFGAFYISDRVPLFAALCALGCVSFVNLGKRSSDWLLASVIIACSTTRIVEIAISWHAYAATYREFQAVASSIPSGAVVVEAMVGAGHHETKVPRCEMFGPILVLQDHAAVPLFSDPNQQPLLEIGKLRAAVDNLQSSVALPGQETMNFEPYISAASRSGFDYILVCNSNLISIPVPDGEAVVLKSQHFELLRTAPMTKGITHAIGRT